MRIRSNAPSFSSHRIRQRAGGSAHASTSEKLLSKTMGQWWFAADGSTTVRKEISSGRKTTMGFSRWGCATSSRENPRRIGLEGKLRAREPAIGGAFVSCAGGRSSRYSVWVGDEGCVGGRHTTKRLDGEVNKPLEILLAPLPVNKPRPGLVVLVAPSSHVSRPTRISLLPPPNPSSKGCLRRRIAHCCQ